MPVKDYSWKVKLIVDKISYLKQIMKFKRSPIKPFYIAFKGVTSEETANVLKHSKVAIDVPVQGQNGLTMRTIETLAAHTKIITTNRNIKEYDFYNPDNVEIIDRNDPQIREDFVDSPYTPIDDGIIEKYSLGNWVRRLLICEDKI